MTKGKEPVDVGRDVEMSGELNLKTGLVINIKAFGNCFPITRNQ